ncbi:alpha-amylase family glycosyl hydrolase [Afifella marina]|uniref:Cyclomaltodextrinase n=1 Tax=Afifella marina DSM 2698 TaxID=1120955 RepID=A0A1G5NDU4_AFIMA|nr:alpha-amylase family glycosyl hydrolase [Afifella marina]MBK1623264.1 alpha-amylase [Afifella marina DSM 2698]MBK1626258.1 alpha-amylase [Afifella marina]MBK5917136.1 alpha-amylase [Afifella marina]RAI22116.1 alpha-amylase [Afifella marina DSM 2698]SCZ34951.1 cyclomaltodextrinase [Afifella marina DSM 2698]
MVDWVKHAIAWHVYPLGFAGAESENDRAAPVAHRLPRLESYLDYAVELGASALALGPIFQSATHGYDTLDYFAIDRRLGDENDFDRLVREANARGLKIILDGVFNHVGRDHPFFRDVCERGPQSDKAAWFRLTWPQGWQSGNEPQYESFEGHDQLVALNHDEPAVAEYVASVMDHWLARGADGWRLDAAYAVPPAFWAKILPGLRRKHPNVFIFGEVIHGDYPAVVSESGFDSLTQYELWKALWSALNDRNFFELAWALKRNDALLDGFVPVTFLGNHDVTRIASKLSDERHLPHAVALLFTLPGTPFVYYGDEQAFRGIKEDRVGGDDAIRPAFPDSPGELSDLGAPIFRLHQELIGLRRRHAWLHGARVTVHHLENEALVYESAAEGEKILVALNLQEAPARLPVPAARELLAGEANLEGEGEERVAVVPAHGFAVLGF